MHDDLIPMPPGAKGANLVHLPPTWSGLLPLLIDGIRHGDETRRTVAEEELARLARFIDGINAENSAAPDLVANLRRWHDFAKANGWTDADHHDADRTGWISSTEAALVKAGAL